MGRIDRGRFRGGDRSLFYCLKKGKNLANPNEIKGWTIPSYDFRGYFLGCPNRVSSWIYVCLNLYKKR